jgi:hypothetical protein
VLGRIEDRRCGAQRWCRGQWLRMELVAPQSSPMRQWRRQLTGGVALHEDPPLACVLEHPSWRLTGSVEAAVASEQRGEGVRGEQMLRWR